MSKFSKSDESNLFEQGKEAGESLGRTRSKIAEPQLDAIDKEELERIQNAIAFLKDVRKDFDHGEKPQFESIDTVSIAKHSTLGQFGKPVTEEPSSSPQVIDRYLIKRLLGQGGFAKVFLAHDPKLNRSVALKVLKPSKIFSSEVSARFEREARAAAVLNHPNIVPVFESGTAGPNQFIVSAYFEAEPLDDWFRAKNRSIACETAAKIIATLADATEHAHQRGVLHRDLKPANVLIQSETDGEHELRITDFGLAKHLGATDQLQTTEGAVVGTPAYMSPEQAEGASEIGGATDIYSLGVMLYELLTGQLPILGATYIDTLLEIRSQEPKPMPRSLPVDLRAICMKCLRKRTEERYHSAFELAEDLRRWLNGKPVNARRVSQVERLKKWCFRNPALTIALIGTTAGLVFSLTQWQRADQHWKNSQSETQRAKDEANRAQSSILLNQLTIKELVLDISSSTDIPADLSYVLIGRAAKSQTRLLSKDPENEDLILQLCEINIQYADALTKVEKFAEAELVCDESLDVLKPLMDSDSPPLNIRNVLRGLKAVCLTARGKSEQAVELLRANIEGSDSNLQNANDLRLSALAFVRAGKKNKAYIDFQKSKLIFESLDPNNVYVLAEWVLLNRDFARLEANEENFEEAERLLESALEQQQTVLQTVSHEMTDGQISRIKSELAGVKTRLEKFDEAEELLAGVLNELKAMHQDDLKNVRIQHALLAAHLNVVELAFGQEDFSKAAEGLGEVGSDYRGIQSRLTTHEDWGGTIASWQIMVTQKFSQEGLPEFDQRLADAQEFLDYLKSEYPEGERWEGYQNSLDAIGS